MGKWLDTSPSPLSGVPNMFIIHDLLEYFPY